MLLLKYIILGIVQGLTEFLPVSSSAHLVLFQRVLSIENNQLTLDIVLHLGTLLAVIAFLAKDIPKTLTRKVVTHIVLATAVTSAVVLAAKDFFESLFESPDVVALPLLATGIILLSTKKFSQGKRDLSQMRLGDAGWFGLVQGLAVIPGLSRSGITISTLLARGVERETAFKFSFLGSILAILGALCLEFGAFADVSRAEFGYMSLAFVASFLSGVAALRLLFLIIRRARFHLFGYYCIIVAVILWLIKVL